MRLTISLSVNGAGLTPTPQQEKAIAKFAESVIFGSKESSDTPPVEQTARKFGKRPLGNRRWQPGEKERLLLRYKQLNQAVPQQSRKRVLVTLAQEFGRTVPSITVQIDRLLKQIDQPITV